MRPKERMPWRNRLSGKSYSPLGNETRTAKYTNPDRVKQCLSYLV